MFQQQPNQKKCVEDLYRHYSKEDIKWPKSTQKDAQRH